MAGNMERQLSKEKTMANCVITKDDPTKDHTEILIDMVMTRVYDGWVYLAVIYGAPLIECHLSEAIIIAVVRSMEYHLDNFYSDAMKSLANAIVKALGDEYRPNLIGIHDLLNGGKSRNDGTVLAEHLRAAIEKKWDSCPEIQIATVERPEDGD